MKNCIFINMIIFHLQFVFFVKGVDNVLDHYVVAGSMYHLKVELSISAF